MWWTLEEDEAISPPSYALTNSRDQVGTIAFTITSDASPRPLGSTVRKRTRFEALERASPVLELSTALGQSFPLARPYTTLFNASFATLVLVDPLNRLEGLS